MTAALAALQVDITLTAEGVGACFCPEEAGPAAVPLRPLALVFSYLAMLAREPPEHSWQELKVAAAAQFRCGSSGAAAACAQRCRCVRSAAAVAGSGRPRRCSGAVSGWFGQDACCGINSGESTLLVPSCSLSTCDRELLSNSLLQGMVLNGVHHEWHVAKRPAEMRWAGEVQV